MQEDGKEKYIPKWPLHFFRWFCRPEMVEDIEGDLVEKFGHDLRNLGKNSAQWKLAVQVMLLFRPGIVRDIIGRNKMNPMMIKQHFKVSYRSLRKNKGYTWINVGGLALGIMAALLIGLWMQDEITYNSQVPHADRIAQVMQNQHFGDGLQTSGNQPMQLATVLREEYRSYFDHVATASWTGERQIDWGAKKMMISGNFIEPGITEMLALHMLEGSIKALEDPSHLLLSRSAADGLFGATDPLGQMVQIGSKMKVEVAGIYEDIAENNSFGGLDFIAPWDLLRVTANYDEIVGWGNNWFRVYVALREGVDIQVASTAIKDVKLAHMDPEFADRIKPELFLHPMNRWRLYERFENGVNAGGRIEYVWIFGIIALFILGLACINFMNLTTARSEKRAREVGIRKTIGSERSQLITQFFAESLLVVSIAFAVAAVFTWFIMPYFNNITGKQLLMPWASAQFWSGSLLFIVILSLVAGSYPAFYLSSFRPIHALSGVFSSYGKTVTLRRVLVTLQFVVSVTLIISTLVIIRQLQFAQQRPIGYNQDNIITIPIKSAEVMKHYETLRQELLSTGDVAGVAASDVRMTSTYTTNSGFYWEGKDPNFSEEFNTLRATHGYGDLVKWEIKEGRDFSPQYGTDSLAFILNETAVEYMGLDEPIGKRIQWGKDDYLNGVFQVIGVVNDMITTSPYEAVRPMIYILHYGRFISYLNIKIDGSSTAGSALAKIEEVYKKYDPVNIFSYRFMDEEYAQKFGNERRLVKIAAYFAVIAIFISCIGLFGISALVAEQRRKEMGVRKVLGAPVETLWLLLSREFLIMVGIGVALAIPVSFWYMQDWLQGFSYHTNLVWWMFAAGGLVAVVIAMLTVSFHILRAALSNPVAALRTE